MPRSINLMYNEDLKHEFIRQTAKNTDLYRATFRASAPFEQAAGKDLCMMTAEEAAPIADALCRSKLRGDPRIRTLRAISDYYNWCFSNGVEGALPNPDLDRGALSDAVGKEFIIRSPAHLQRCMDAVFDPESEETIDNVYRCYLWAVYGGLEHDNAVVLKAENIDLHSLSAESLGQGCVLYPEALPSFRNCMQLRSFRYKHPHYSNVILKERIDSDYILRGTRGNAENVGKSLRSDMNRRINKSGGASVKLNNTTVWFSGLYYRMYCDELAYGERPNMITFVLSTPQGKRATENNPQIKTDLKQIIYDMAFQLGKDYDNWKKAIQNI